MLRRDFIAVAGGIVLWPATRVLHADHHVVSATPLVVESDLSSVREHYTPVEDFYVRNHYPVPQTSGLTAIRIEGEVEEPREVSLKDLNSLRQRETPAVLECAGNGVSTIALVSGGLWRGWPLNDVISAAHPKATAAYIHLFGRDGFARSVDLDSALATGLVTTTLNGRPLTETHGAPFRALFPGRYGMDSIKWLDRVVLASSPLPPAGNTYLQIKRESSGTLERRVLPHVKVKSVIVAPRDGDVLHRGKIEVRGLAWSGEGTIAAVRVSFDGGSSWSSAVWGEAASPYDWVAWSATVEISKTGAISLVSKATDSAGNVQPERRDADRVDSYAYNVCGRIRCIVI